MSHLEWDESLCIGVYAIDKQHMKLVELVDEFLEAVARGRGDDITEEIIARLREYTVRHFHDEESYMEEIHYPARGEHHAAHRELARSVKLFQRDLYKRRDVSVDVLRHFLKKWLISHILDCDMKIGEWVRKEEEKKKIKAGEKEVPTQAEQQAENEALSESPEAEEDES